MGRSMAINGWMTKLAKNNVLNKIVSPIVDVQYICASASEVPNRWKEDVMSRPLTVKEIEDMVLRLRPDRQEAARRRHRRCGDPRSPRGLPA